MHSPAVKQPLLLALRHSHLFPVLHQLLFAERGYFSSATLFTNPCEVATRPLSTSEAYHCLLQRRSIHRTHAVLARSHLPPTSIALSASLHSRAYLTPKGTPPVLPPCFTLFLQDLACVASPYCLAATTARRTAQSGNSADLASPYRSLSLHTILTATAAPPPLWVRSTPSPTHSATSTTVRAASCPIASGIHAAAKGSVQQAQCSSDSG